MDWTVLPIPFTHGYAEHEALNAFAKSLGTTLSTNVDFSMKGAVRGREGLVLAQTYASRTLDVEGREETTHQANQSGLTVSGASMFTVKSKSGERPGMAFKGKCYIQSAEPRWVEAGPCLSTRVKRLTALGGLYANMAGTSRQVDMGAAWDIAPNGTDMATTSVGILDTNGNLMASDVASAASLTDMSIAAGARCGQISALFVKQPGTNNLALILHTENSPTVTVIAPFVADYFAANTEATTGYKPMVCCDYDSSVFYLAYKTTVAREIKILRVSTAGAILTTQTFAPATDPLTYWISNSTVAANKLVLAYQDGTAGVHTKVYNATTLVDQAIDVTINNGFEAVPSFNAAGPGALIGGCSVGVVSDTEAVVMHVAPTTLVAGHESHMTISRRSLTAATSRIYWRQRFHCPNPLSAGTTRAQASFVLLAHQPVVLQGRILAGITYVRGVDRGARLADNCWGTSTWIVLDITDLWARTIATGATSGNTRDPVPVARGPSDGSNWTYIPKYAMVRDQVYRFPIIEFQEIEPNPVGTTSEPFTGAGTSIATGSFGFTGSKAQLVLNEVSLQDPQVVSFGDNTIINGNLPFIISGSECYGVPFVVDAPSIRVRQSTWVNGANSFGFEAVYTWTDKAGRVFRSAPSTRLTVSKNDLNPAAGVLEIAVSAPVFSGRRPDEVSVELYRTDANPTFGAPLYLVGEVRWGNVASGFVVPESETNADLFAAGTPGGLLYTTGGVLSCQTPNAQGGVAVVGERCWVSDGVRLFASRLGDEAAGNEAPSWHVDDTLVVNLPVSAGRVVSLQDYEDKLVIFTDTGVWVTTGVGPNDLGQGPMFAAPMRVSVVGCAGPRMSASTPHGIFWLAPNGSNDASGNATGLWALSGERVQQISANVRNSALSDWIQSPRELVYASGRDLLLWSRTAGSQLVLDMRTGQWADWNTGLSSVTEAAAILWLCNSSFTPEASSLTGARGVDTGSGGAVNYMLQYIIGSIPLAEGQGGLGRMRSAKLITELDNTPYTLTITARFDNNDAYSKEFTNYVATTEAEAFFERQKGARVEITVEATKASGVWTGIELLVKPIGRNKQGRRDGVT